LADVGKIGNRTTGGEEQKALRMKRKNFAGKKKQCKKVQIESYAEGKRKGDDTKITSMYRNEQIEHESVQRSRAGGSLTHEVKTGTKKLMRSVEASPKKPSLKSHQLERTMPDKNHVRPQEESPRNPLTSHSPATALYQKGWRVNVETYAIRQILKSRS